MAAPSVGLNMEEECAPALRGLKIKGNATSAKTNKQTKKQTGVYHCRACTECTVKKDSQQFALSQLRNFTLRDGVLMR